MKPETEIIEITPFQDHRGSLKKILMHSRLETGRIEEVYLLYTCKGGVRGNHYHESALEYFTVVSGCAVIVLKDLSTGVLQELKVSAGDNKVIKVPPGVAHAFKNERPQPLIILALSTREYNKHDPDTFTFTLLQ